LSSPLLAEKGVRMVLMDPAPNPASGNVRIQFAAFEAMRVELAIYNLVGEKVSQLFAGEVQSETYTYGYDVSSFASGTYLLSLSSSTGERITKRLILLN
jgi:hypothetical protein